MRRIYLLCATFLALMMSSLSSQAYEVAEVQIAEVVPATATHPELKLNGAALRELYLLVKRYVGSLYLEQPSTSAEDILADNSTHKRMVFHVLMKKVGARRIASALQEALIVNISEAEHRQLHDQIEQMLSYFQGKMHRGEEAWFDFIPQKGTVVSINGEEKGTIKGDLFFRALLSVWIGENPVNRDFKNEILGLNRIVEQTSQVAEGN